MYTIKEIAFVQQVFVSHNLIYRVSSSGQIYPWQLPYSIQSEKCHASTGVGEDTFRILERRNAI